jgi:DHA1 family multidrug resistance protein-like MFS transporter
VFSMCSDVGAIVGPLVAGLLADHISYSAAFAVGAALMLAAAAMSLRMPRTRQPAGQEGGVGEPATAE